MCNSWNRIRWPYILNILEITSPCDADVDMFAMEAYRKRFILRSALLTVTMPKSTMVGFIIDLYGKLSAYLYLNWILFKMDKNTLF